MIRLGPDARHYLALAEGRPVPRPFYLRRLLPALCRDLPHRWMWAWIASWPILIGSMFAWRIQHDDWQTSLATAALLAALPGILGPRAVIPVGVDLPSTATNLAGIALISLGDSKAIIAGVIVCSIAAGIKESAPIWAALWMWSLWPLIALSVPLCVALRRRPGPSPLGATFDEIAAHPVRTALRAHAGRWRDGWLLIAPWGACLAALVDADWRLIVVLAVAHLQLVVATDTVRLLHHAAGPAMAIAAAQTIPSQWLIPAVLATFFWFRVPERI